LEKPEPTARERLSSRVLKIREEKDISLAQLAKAAGIGRNTLYLIETRAANTRLDTVRRLSQALDVEIGCLLSDQEATPLRVRRLARVRRTLSKKVARFRDEKNLSQEDLNRACGFVRGYVWVIENTDQDVTLDTLQKLADALSLSVPDLLDSKAASR
jgi:transcriptional regulator with XRE-family HTH domain